MNEKQLMNQIETVSWEIECTIGDRKELYKRLDQLVLEYRDRFGDMPESEAA